MFIINVISDFINVSMFQYLLGAFGFYGIFLCINKVIFK